MLVHCAYFAGTHLLYTGVERGTLRVNCLAQEHNTVSLIRPQTWTALTMRSLKLTLGQVYSIVLKCAGSNLHVILRKHY